MAQQTLTGTSSRPQPRTLLHKILLVDSLSTGAAGIAFIVASSPIAALMGVANPLALVIIGVLFIAFAAAVYYTASREVINRRAAWFIIELNVVYIVGSAIILLTDAFGLSTEGRWLVLILADLVTVFAIVEFVGLRRLK
jgi:hypothetical protein